MKKTYYIGYCYTVKPGITINKQIEVIGHNKAVAEAYLKFIKTSEVYLTNNRHNAYIEWNYGMIKGCKEWPIVKQIQITES